ncbi:helix-turn-helix domain-containing protein [Lysinibacillus xylanilyticus]|uniref:Helix-turn-helix domain-containing protein n=1 Tax=Lysinibacillus xylanilyticus TaxID=582475 RepID=A0ABT4EKF4_9BACI|nr:helix-turn-helix domain-containing protein [Lysinibacillus xylanilyticus]MCY9545478.1 helix-turn-helix domain-containing protein [Lysinibacillus xylanilyticus]
MHNFDQDLYKEIISMLNDILSHTITNEWLSINSAAKYVGVSYNTFIKFRHMGLKVCEIDGIKRVSRKEIDRFLEEYSY